MTRVYKSIKKQPRSNYFQRYSKKGFLFITVGVLSLGLILPFVQNTNAVVSPTIHTITPSTSLSTAGGETVVINGSALTNIKQIATSRLSAYALGNNGLVYSWGDTKLTPSIFSFAGSALEGKTVTQLGYGRSHMLAIDENGLVYGWGDNSVGQLGNGSNSTTNSPVAVTATGTPMEGKKIIKVTGGNYFSVALADDGSLYAWGQNNTGQLGNGIAGNSYVPVAVATTGTPMEGKTIVDISSEVSSTVAVASDGSVYAWGSGANGQLGNGSVANSNVPVAVTTAGTPMAGKTIVSVDRSSSSVIALASDGTLYGWGRNYYGELGAGNNTQSTTPIATNMSGALAGKTVVAIDAAGTHHSVLTSEGKLYTIGTDYSTSSSLASSHNTPTLFDTAGTPMDGVELKATSSTYNYGLALDVQGKVYAWGDNSSAVFGNGEITPNSLKPVSVKVTGTPMEAKTISSISGGGAFSIALADDGSIYTWGDNSYGQLGNNSTDDSYIPTQVVTTGTPMEGKTIIAISGGLNHTLALDSNGEVYAWGNNNEGQLGNNTYDDGLLPELVTKVGTPMEGKTIVAISASRQYSLALANDGTVYSWGYGGDRTLGNGSFSSSPLPTAVDTTGVLAGKSVSKIEAGEYHVLVLTSDNGLYAWGANSDGQLGDGGTTSSSVPVAVDTSGVLSGKTIVSLSAQDYFSHVVTSDGRAYAWGANYDGQLGDGTLLDTSTPIAVNTSGVLSGVTLTTIDSGQYSTIASATNGAVYGWGGGWNGEVGSNSLATPFALPVAVYTSSTPMSGKHIVQVAMGYWHSLALASDGSVYTWGDDSSGQLGDGENPTMAPPVVSNAGALGILTSPPTITINGVSASNVAIIDTNHISFVSPARQDGTYTISLEFTDGRTASTVNGLSYGTGVTDPGADTSQPPETHTPSESQPSTSTQYSSTWQANTSISDDTNDFEQFIPDAETDSQKENDSIAYNPSTSPSNTTDTASQEDTAWYRDGATWTIWIALGVALIILVAFILRRINKRRHI